MSEFFTNLKIDRWYMVFVYLGGVLLIFSLFLPVQWITNKQLILISSGILFIGLGEWKNKKYLTSIDHVTGVTVTTKIRKPDILGLLFDIIGLFFLVVGIADVIGIDILKIALFFF